MADLDFRQSRAYWKAPYVTDDLPGFNPHIGAKTYVSWWLYPLGKLAPGDYSGLVQELTKHTTTDLLAWEGNHSLMYKPALTVFDQPALSFTVQ